MGTKASKPNEQDSPAWERKNSFAGSVIESVDGRRRRRSSTSDYIHPRPSISAYRRRCSSTFTSVEIANYDPDGFKYSSSYTAQQPAWAARLASVSTTYQREQNLLNKGKSQTNEPFPGSNGKQGHSTSYSQIRPNLNAMCTHDSFEDPSRQTDSLGDSDDILENDLLFSDFDDKVDGLLIKQDSLMSQDDDIFGISDHHSMTASLYSQIAFDIPATSPEALKLPPRTFPTFLKTVCHPGHNHQGCHCQRQRSADEDEK